MHVNKNKQTNSSNLFLLLKSLVVVVVVVFRAIRPHGLAQYVVVDVGVFLANVSLVRNVTFVVVVSF